MSDSVVTIDRTEYLQKLVKLIPSEIIAIYLAIAAFVPGDPVVQFIVAGLALVLTPLYLINVGKVKNTLQIVVSTISFAVWVFVTGGPFATMAWYQPWIPGALLAAYTLIVPLFVPAQAPAPVATASGSKKLKASTKSWREI